MSRKHTFRYFLIIIVCSVVPALLLRFTPGGSKIPTEAYPLIIALPSLLCGLVVQSLVNFRGMSKRSPLNGSAYYGAYIAVILSALRVGFMFVAIFSRV